MASRMRLRVTLALVVAAAFGLVCGGDELVNNTTSTPPPEQQPDPIDQPEPEPELPPVDEPPPEPLVPTDPAPPWSGKEPVVYDFNMEAEQASTDEAQNLWVITPTRLHVLRAGASSWLRFDTGDGLRDWPLISVEGARANEAYVGYRGIFGPDPLTDPEEVQRSGDLDRITLNADDTITVFHFDLHNTNNPAYDESRIIKRIHYVHDGPKAGELFVGTSHGAVRIVGEAYSDHVHPYTKVPNAQGELSNRFGDMNCLAVRPDGNLLLGNNYKLAEIGTTVGLEAWWDSWQNDWLWARHAWAGDKTEPISCQQASMGPDGTAYFASRLLGLAVLPPENDPKTQETAAFEFPQMPSNEMYAVAADPDGTVWVGSRLGLDRWDPATGKIFHYGADAGVPDGLVRHLDVDTITSPRTVVGVAGGNVVVITGE
jgi:hypothetical protein